MKKSEQTCKQKLNYVRKRPIHTALQDHIILLYLLSKDIIREINAGNRSLRAVFFIINNFQINLECRYPPALTALS